MTTTYNHYLYDYYNCNYDLTVTTTTITSITHTPQTRDGEGQTDLLWLQQQTDRQTDRYNDSWEQTEKVSFLTTTGVWYNCNYDLTVTTTTITSITHTPQTRDGEGQTDLLWLQQQTDRQTDRYNDSWEQTEKVSFLTVPVCQKLFQPTKPYAARSIHHSVTHHSWKHRPGHPCINQLQQINWDSGATPADLWYKAIKHGRRT